MTELLNEAAAAMIPACGIMGMVCVCGAISYVVDLLGGDAELPRFRRKRKTPRKAATKRGIVGQRIRRSTCICTTIVPQPTLDVKCDLPLRVEWRWMRG